MVVSRFNTDNIEYAYSPGWLNRLNDWIDSMPGPAGIYYLAGFLARLH